MNKLRILIIALIIGLIGSACSLGETLEDIFGERAHSAEVWEEDPEADDAPSDQESRVSEAIEQALSTLAGAYNLESDLRLLDSTAQTAADSLVSLEATRSTLDAIDQLKAISIPFLGSAWDLLVQAMDAVYYGSGTTLESLDSGLREVLAFKDDLENVSDLDDVADLVSAFRQSPSDANLDNLLDGVEQTYDGLVAIQTRVDSLFGELTGLISDIKLVQQVLSSVLYSLDIPAVTDIVNTLNAGIADMLTYAESAFSFVTDFSIPLSQSLAVMDALRQGGDVGMIPQNPGVPDAPPVNPPANPPDDPTAVPQVISPTFTPTQRPTETPIPPAAIDDPIERIRSYWEAVSEERYADAWEMLTDSFKERKHDDSFEDYKNTYLDKAYCSITVSEMRVLQEGQGYALVYAVTTYRYGTNCATVAEYEFDYELIFNSEEEIYQIEKLKEHQ